MTTRTAELPAPMLPDPRARARSCRSRQVRLDGSGPRSLLAFFIRGETEPSRLKLHCASPSPLLRPPRASWEAYRAGAYDEAMHRQARRVFPTCSQLRRTRNTNASRDFRGCSEICFGCPRCGIRLCTGPRMDTTLLNSLLGCRRACIHTAPAACPRDQSHTSSFFSRRWAAWLPPSRTAPRTHTYVAPASPR